MVLTRSAAAKASGTAAAASNKGSSRILTLTNWKANLEAALLSWQQSHREVLVVHVCNELQHEVQQAVYAFQEQHGARLQQDVFDKVRPRLH